MEGAGDAADRVDQGLQLAPDLVESLQHGTEIGGAELRALVESGKNKENKHVGEQEVRSNTE